MRKGTVLENVWLGVTAENQEMADQRIPILLQIPAAKRFVSIEPCLKKINIKGYLEYIEHLNWVIVGCESGPRRRPCKIEWVRSIVQQCKDTAVPVFVKQLSIDGKVSHDMNEWPADLRIREFPVQRAEEKRGL
jgi:protein gp37